MASGFIWLVAGIVSAGAAVVFFNKTARTARALRRASPKPIAAAPLGVPVKLVGELRLLERHLFAPLTGRKCAYYEVQVDEHKTEKKDQIADLFLAEDLGTPFLLDDGTGVALIDTAWARVVLSTDHSTTSGPVDDPTVVEQGFLSRYQETGRNLRANKYLRYEEAVLEPGERVAVLGVAAVPTPEQLAKYSDDPDSLPPIRLRVFGTERSPILISDDPDLLD